MPDPSPVIELIGADIPRAQSASPAPLLREVNWRVCAGEFWAVGASAGRGKTALLCTAAALQRPLKGFHLLFGKDVRAMDEHELVRSHRQVAMVFDNGRLFPSLTLEENLTLPLAYHGGLGKAQAAERVGAILRALALDGMRGRFPREITRNLHQRAALGRALALDPEALLIDSPLQALEPRQARWWLDFLGQLSQGHALANGRPLTIVAATDNLRPWAELAGRFAVIENQAVSVVGGRGQLRESPDGAVQELLGPAGGG